MTDTVPAEPPPPDTETVILDGRLWRIVHVVGEALVDGKARRLIEIEEV